MPNGHRIYLRFFGGCVASGLAAMAMFNVLVDPLGAYPTLSLKTFQPYRGHLTSRAAKAELIAHGECEVLLLGSSRVEVGLPVDHPGYGSSRVYNLGLNGTTLPELSAVLDYALRHNRLKRVLLGADFLLFSDVRGPRLDFENSRFNPHLNLFEYHCRNLFGSEATIQSWSLLHQAMWHQDPPTGEHGFIPKTIPRRLGQRTVFAARIRSFLTNPETYGGFHYSQQRLEFFRDMLRRCAKNGVEVIVFIPPVHALQLQTIHASGLWPTFEQWKGDVTGIIAEEAAVKPIALWDFSGFQGRVAENVPPAGDKTTRMKWYVDSSHFTPALGELVLERVLGRNNNGQAAEDGFGVRLTPANLESHLSRLRADHEAYTAAHPDEIVWVEQIAAAAKGQVWTKASDP